MFIAASMLFSLAFNLPAISNAVPWSGDVLIKGNPRVVLTASSKAISFTGMRPWSWYKARIPSGALFSGESLFHASAAEIQQVSGGIGPLILTAGLSNCHSFKIGIIRFCSSIPIFPSSPAWGFNPAICILGFSLNW